MQIATLLFDEKTLVHCATVESSRLAEWRRLKQELGILELSVREVTLPILDSLLLANT